MEGQELKKKILQMIKDKLKTLRAGRERLAVDRIDEVAMKELHNEILKI